MMCVFWLHKVNTGIKQRFYIIQYAAFMVLVLAACNRGETVVDADVLFHEEFIAGETADWSLEGDEIAQTAVIDEQLVIEINEANVIQFATLPEPQFTDFVLEVDARLLAGEMENSFGVLFRMQNSEAFYRCEITGNGLYMVERRNADGTWTQFLDDWKESPAINQGLTVPNRLKVVAVGPSISFYVNDLLLEEINDSTYATGTVALDAGTFGPGGVRVAFDNLVVRRP